MSFLEGVEEVYVLSPFQQGLLFHCLDSPSEGQYIDQFVLDFEGDLDADALRAAWERVVARQPILRTSFHWQGLDRPVQVVRCAAGLDFEVQDLRSDSAEFGRAAIDRRLERDRHQGFNLTEPPLVRVVLLRLGEKRHSLLLTVHHLILDGWSCGLIREQVLTEYAAAAKGTAALSDGEPRFSDYVAWLEQQDAAAAQKFWQRELAGIKYPTLAADFLASRSSTVRTFDTEWSLPRGLSQALDDLARRCQVSASNVFQAAWGILLGRYGGWNDVVFGLTVSGRPPSIAGIERMVGNLINTVPFRVRLDPDKAVRDLLIAVRNATTRLRPFEHTPLAEIQRWHGATANRALFDSILVFENATAPGPPPAVAGLQISGSRHLFRTNYPIVLQVSPEAEITIRIACLGGGIGQAAVARLANQLTALLESMARDPAARVGGLQMLSPAERHLAALEWNDTERPFPARSIVELFEEQAAAKPEAVALQSDRGAITYAELNKRSARWARRLRFLGVAGEKRVALLAGRTIDMVAATLGILKAGGTCVPLDAAAPLVRLQVLLRDSGASIVLVEPGVGATLKEIEARIVVLDEHFDAAFEDGDPQAPPYAEQAAYLMYTSGSTGHPKGVAVTHRGIVRLVREANYARLDATQVSFAHSPVSFDASFFELWGAMLNGGRCVLFNGRALTPVDLRHAVAQHGVNLVWLTASLFHLVIDEDPDSLRGVRQLIAGGEVVSRAHAARAAAHLPDCAVSNGYGPTEGTTFSACQIISAAPGPMESAPLGRPIANTRIYILDAGMVLCPAGAAGELYIGGSGLARGYDGAADLTAERFLPDPFSECGGRLYRTGDRARWLHDGRIEFLGRTDAQVKVRGFRIEPGDVESVLRQNPQVRDCAVVAAGEPVTGKRLVAYIVPVADGALDIDELRRTAASALPEYMVPAEFHSIAALPLTANGKLDRAALAAATPEPREASGAARRGQGASPTEEILLGIWGDVLDAPGVSRDSNFFELGGHSLLAIRVLSRMREAFLTELPLRILFTHPVLCELAREVDRLCGTGHPPEIPPIEALPHYGNLPLSFAQQRLWVIDRLEPGIPAYNLPMAFLLQGGPGNLPALLALSLEAVVERHEVLRTSLPAVEGTPVQRISARAEIALHVVDLTEVDVSECEAATRRLISSEALRPFDLGRGPLIRATLVSKRPAEYVLLLTLHHIVADGSSLEILFDELTGAYAELSQNRQLAWKPLPVQYSDYARWQRGWMQGGLLERLLTFWRDRLMDVPASVRLPFDRPRPAVQTFRGGRRSIAFSPRLSSAIGELALAERSTLFMTLLAGFFALLHRWTGDEDLLVGTAAANRNRTELEPLIGFFANTLVMRTRVSGRTSFRELVATVREATLKAYAHQDLPFEKLVEELQPARHLGSSPYFQTAFAMLEAKPVRQLQDLTITPIEIESVAAKFDLTLYALRSNGLLTISAEYNCDLFDGTTIARLLESYEQIMTGASEDPARTVSELPVLPDAARHHLLQEWNDTQALYPRGILMHELFEAQVERTPDSAALVHGGERVTYRQLNAMANCLARRLQQHGAGPEKTVGVFARRSIKMVAALLAVLKAGSAYVPLDPEYPAQRLAFMLHDVGASIVVTEKSLEQRLGRSNSGSLLLEDVQADFDEPNLARVTLPENAAYVIYTSGSTGRPKGIIIEHRNAVVLLHWVRENFPPDELAGMLAATSVCFDVSIFELFGPLSWGGSIRIIENALEMPAFAGDPEVRLAGSVPSAMAELVRVHGVPQFATTVNLAGEPAPRGLADEIYQSSGARRITNLYGPSEDTTFSSMALLRRGAKEPPSIGRPLANTRFYVLDTDFQIVPFGAIGQVFIAGDGLSRGYLGRPDLTADRFLPDPHSVAPGARMYRTGDLARYLKNGELDCLGRMDHQVKIRGFRVELGEIETVLREQPGVRQAVVIARPAEPQIAAYIVTDGDAIGVAELEEAAKARLPVYMIPGAFVIMPALPTLPNGKIDRSALPDPGSVPSEESPEFSLPRTALEGAICDVLAEILNRTHVGAHDHFFSGLGAHSLLLIQAAVRLQDRLQSPVSVIEMFQFPTAASLAAHLASTDRGVAVAQDQDAPERRGKAAAGRREFRRATRVGTAL